MKKLEARDILLICVCINVPVFVAFIAIIPLVCLVAYRDGVQGDVFASRVLGGYLAQRSTNANPLKLLSHEMETHREGALDLLDLGDSFARIPSQKIYPKSKLCRGGKVTS